MAMADQQSQGGYAPEGREPLTRIFRFMQTASPPTTELSR